MNEEFEAWWYQYSVDSMWLNSNGKVAPFLYDTAKSAFAAGQAAERDACAELAEVMGINQTTQSQETVNVYQITKLVCYRVAAAIRARK